MSSGPFYDHPGDRVTDRLTPSIETGTAQTGYGPTYLTAWDDENMGRPSLLNETSGAWKLHSASNRRMDFVLIQHNLDEALAGVDFRFGGTFGAPTGTAPIAVPAKRADGYTVKIFQDLRGVAGYSTGGFTDFWLKVTGVNSVPIGAKVWGGQLLRQLTFNVDWGLVEADVRPGIVLSTDFIPAAWAYDFAVTPRIWTSKISNASDADRDAVQAWLRAAGYGLTCVVPDPIGRPHEGWLVRLLMGGSPGETTATKRTLDKGLRFLNVNEVPLVLEELTAGAPEWS